MDVKGGIRINSFWRKGTVSETDAVEREIDLVEGGKGCTKSAAEEAFPFWQSLRFWISSQFRRFIA